MKKSIGKSISKSQQKKLKIAFKARKIRKKNKAGIIINTQVKNDSLLLVKRNLLPVLILIVGCVLFYFSNEPKITLLQDKNDTLDNSSLVLVRKEAKKDFQVANSTDIAIISGASAATIEESEETIALREDIIPLVKGKPMEAMVEEILKQDKMVAAFLLGIGMKESNYGKFSPKKDGKDCFNYWGYRGKENQTKSGYSCFDSPEHAVQVVGGRIAELVDYGRTTPEKMIVWKCGYSCAGHGEENVKKWIADVSINYYNLMD